MSRFKTCNFLLTLKLSALFLFGQFLVKLKLSFFFLSLNLLLYLMKWSLYCIIPKISKCGFGILEAIFGYSFLRINFWWVCPPAWPFEKFCYLLFPVRLPRPLFVCSYCHNLVVQLCWISSYRLHRSFGANYREA